jgi:hypothetical protein
MNNREKALEELKRRIEEQKARVDPEVLRRAAEVAESHMQRHDSSVPYDRKAAIKAVELFLKSHRDPKDIERLIAAIVAKTHH